MRPGLARTLPAALAALALLAAGCGDDGIQLAEDDPDYEANYEGAVLFAERCSGCHTLEAAGAVGSADRELRNQGPSLDERQESPEDVLYAIQNGGFSGSIMPQNIVTGEEAELVADFVAAYSGTAIDRPPTPGVNTEDLER